jgi:hypothetical protein
MDTTSNCPLCNYPIDPTDISVTCNHCGNVNEHHNVMFQCGFCQTDLEKVVCPNCHKEFTGMLLLGSYTYKLKGIEPFNIPPVDNNDAALFLRKITGEEEFDFRWDKKPKSMMIYELIYSPSGQSSAKGMLLSVSIDLWEHLLGSGEFSTLEGYLKKYVIGSISIVYDNSSPISVNAKPLQL